MSYSFALETPHQYIIFLIKKILKECDLDKDLNGIQKIKFRNLNRQVYEELV
ncbi:hypothetical protein SRABI04_01985 [Chryseobacterium sp. Bi04]|nr:hypothetical protein SRABI04_01985 [Chryseobacterium sp. Bi04]